MTIPRVTDQQFVAGNGSPVRKAELLPGDLVFFREPGGYIHHVGISMGGSQFLHAPHTGDVVKVSNLNEPYYKAQFAGGRRFADAAAAAPAAAAPAAGAPAAAAAAAAPAAGAPVGVDPAAVASAQAALARDAAEARRPASGLFKAISVQEARNHEAAARAAAADGKQQDSALFLQAITPEDAAAAKGAPAPEAAPAAAAAAVPPPDGAAPPPAGAAPDLSDVPADYPGDNASQAELAKWLAKEAQKAGLPPELPVMAALVESGVKNLNFGDADSVGFFQMRLSIWNSGPYAGYPDNPGLQIKWFVDQAVALKKQRIAGGDANFGQDPSTWGEWIADVERPAEQFRGRYQPMLGKARELLA